MARELDLAWLAGIVDGEGCIYGHWHNRGRYSTGGGVNVEVRIQATSFAMIAKVASICKDSGIKFVMDAQWRPKSTKPAHRVSVRRRADVVLFLKAVRPYLVVKGAEADVVLQWYEKWGDQRGIGKQRASHEDKVVLFDTLRNLKKIA